MAADKIRDAETFAAGLSARLLHCRELGHEWRDHTVTFDRRDRTFERSLKCRSCHTIRRQILSTGGHVLGNSYNYADGYLSTDVLNRDGLNSRDVFRLESLNRLMSAHKITDIAERTA
jgi:hypothetical protein